MPLNGDGKLIVIDTQGLTDAIESYHIGRLKELKKTRLSAPIVSYTEAANTLGISENALRQRVKVGKIAFIRKGRKRYISLAELERHLVNPDTHLTPAGK